MFPVNAGANVRPPPTQFWIGGIARLFRTFRVNRTLNRLERLRGHTNANNSALSLSSHPTVRLISSSTAQRSQEKNSTVETLKFRAPIVGIRKNADRTRGATWLFAARDGHFCMAATPLSRPTIVGTNCVGERSATSRTEISGLVANSGPIRK